MARTKSKPAAEPRADTRNHAWWMNWCQYCGGRYYVRASDINKDRMRRYVSPESDERHVCAEVGA